MKTSKNDQEQNLSNSIISIISMFFFALIYVPFVWALIFKSIITWSAVDPSDYETALDKTSWLFSFSIFGGVIFFIYYMRAIQWWGLVVVIVPLLVLHICISIYTHLRPELCIIRKKSKLYIVCACFLTSANPCNWRNWVFFFGVLVEFFQFMFAAFDSRIPWNWDARNGSFKNSLGQMNSYIFFDYIDVAFYGGVLFVFFHMMFVGYFIQTGKDYNHWFAPVVYNIMPGVLFVGCMSALLRVASTTNSTTYQVISLFFLFYYGSTSVFVGIYRADKSSSRKSDVEWSPRFQVLERLMKELWTFVYILMPVGIVSLLSMACIEICYLFLMLYFWPCSVSFFIKLKSLLLSVSIFVLLCAALCFGGPNYAHISNMILFYGSFSICIAAIVIIILCATGVIKRSTEKKGKSRSRIIFDDQPPSKDSNSFEIEPRVSSLRQERV